MLIQKLTWVLIELHCNLGMGVFVCEDFIPIDRVGVAQVPIFSYSYTAVFDDSQVVKSNLP